MAKEITAQAEAIPKLREVFRENGFEGASLSLITQQTGLGKSSLYHHFPAGKTEMAALVLDDIEQWFEEYVYAPLRNSGDAVSAVRLMFKEVNRYFDYGNRICLFGAFALDNTRQQFPDRINNYFKTWVASLCKALRNSSLSKSEAKTIAEDAVACIQGALVLARSQNDARYFSRIIKRLEKRILDKLYERN